MQIRIYEPPRTDGAPFDIQAVLTRPSKAVWREYYSYGGTFEIEYPADGEGAGELKKGRVILIEGYYPGYIDSVIRWFDASGSWVRVSGFHALGLLGLRNIVPSTLTGYTGMAGFDDRTGPTEGIIKGYIAANLTSPAVAARAWPGVRVAPGQGRGIPDDRYSARYNPLDATVRELCDAAGLGITAVADIQAGTVTLDCMEGADRTWGNPALPPLVFDPARGNVLSMRLTDSDAAMRNTFYTTLGGAEFVDEALTLTYWRDQDAGEDIPAGAVRREAHIEISVSTPFAGDEYNDLKRQALNQMTRYETALCFEAEINTNEVVYRRDFGLGDLVTVQNKSWGVTMNTRITGVEITVDGGSQTCKVTFGNPELLPWEEWQRDIKRGG